VTERAVEPMGRVRLLGSGRDDDLDELAAAEAVVGVGVGVDPAEYDLLRPLLDVLGAQLAATRKVTDEGWQPRSRQVGLTGRSLAPRLYVAIGLSGKFNHLVGVRGAGKIVAINNDPGAKVFAAADVGIVGDWHQVVPLLVQRIAQDGRVEFRA
jgi:electron transfer flavoprotein alpha subunit